MGFTNVTEQFNFQQFILYERFCFVTHYEDIKTDTKCGKWGGLGGI